MFENRPSIIPSTKLFAFNCPSHEYISASALTRLRFTIVN